MILTVKRSLQVVFYFIPIFLINITKAQDHFYKIETKKDTRIVNLIGLDGKRATIKVIPDYENHILKILCSKDTIKIYEYWGVPPEVNIINKNFVQIVYSVRSGTDMALKNILLLCVNEQKVYQAMHVLKSFVWQGMGVNGDYNIKLKLDGDNKNNYKLTINVHDSVNSKSETEENFNFNNLTVLSFDIKKHVFYNIKEVLGNLKFLKRTGKGTTQTDHIFPTIILGKEKYYFMKNNWYQLDSSNKMYEIH